MPTRSGPSWQEFRELGARRADSAHRELLLRNIHSSPGSNHFVRSALFLVRYGLALLVFIDASLIDFVLYDNGCLVDFNDGLQLQPAPIIWTPADGIFTSALLAANLVGLAIEAGLRIKTRTSVFSCSDYPSFSRLAY